MFSEAFEGGIPGLQNASSAAFNLALLTPAPDPGTTAAAVDELRLQRASVASERTLEAAPPAPAAVPAMPMSQSTAVPDQASILATIDSAFAPLGPQGVTWAERIARCESSYIPTAVNTASEASGLFQFLPSTWAGTPYSSQSVFDPQANAKAAAWLLQRYGPSQWQCR